MREVEIAKGEIYHVFNRGTEKRKIFLSRNDYERFLVSLIIFNTEGQPLYNLSRYNTSSACLRIPNDPLVKIHAFVLLSNHFHFILEPLVDDGVARLMHRLEMGYAQYFNRLNKRSGNLFQGAYKIVHVDNDAYLNFLPLYIHLNPLDLLPNEIHWKDKGVRNKKKAIEFLKKYPWSSLQSYLDFKNQPFLEKNLLGQIYEKADDWERELTEWLPDENSEDFAIEP